MRMHIIFLWVWGLGFCIIPSHAAVLYHNPLEQASDLDDWTFHGSDPGNWQISAQAVTINYAVNNLNGLYNPGGWNAQKYAVLDPALDLLDARVLASFNTTGNNAGYVAFELRKDGTGSAYQSGVTFEIHRYHMLIFDGSSLLSSNLFFGVGNPRFDGMSSRGLYTLDATVRDNTYSARILFESDQGHVYYLTNQFGNATMSGTLNHALDSGNAAIRYTTHTASPYVYDFQILDVPSIPEPGTALLMLWGVALAGRYRKWVREGSGS